MVKTLDKRSLQSTILSRKLSSNEFQVKKTWETRYESWLDWPIFVRVDNYTKAIIRIGAKQGLLAPSLLVQLRRGPYSAMAMMSPTLFLAFYNSSYNDQNANDHFVLCSYTTMQPAENMPHMSPWAFMVLTLNWGKHRIHFRRLLFGHCTVLIIAKAFLSFEKRCKWTRGL